MLSQASQDLRSLFERGPIFFTNGICLVTCCFALGETARGEKDGSFICDEGHVTRIESYRLVVGRQCLIKLFGLVQFVPSGLAL